LKLLLQIYFQSTTLTQLKGAAPGQEPPVLPLLRYSLSCSVLDVCVKKGAGISTDRHLLLSNLRLQETAKACTHVQYH